MLGLVLNEVLRYPNALHCFAALSYTQLQDTSIPAFETFLEELHIPFVFRKSDMTYIVRGKTKVIFRAAETSDRMRSVEIGSLYCDELAYWREKDFKTFIGRLREKHGSRRFRTATTPNGLNFFYKHFVKNNESGSKKMIQTSTYDNKHLPEEYIGLLKESYDSEMQKQELDGEFITAGAEKTYYMFDTKKHVCDFPIEDAQYHGLDFNVNPLAGVACFVVNDIIYVVDELWLTHANTYKAASEIERRHGSNVVIVPDSTGSARKTSAVKSDHEILREKFTVARVRNPHRKDRFNCVNGLLEKGRIKIHPSCVHLIQDLDCFCEGKSDDEYGHISDAFGYVCWYLFPIRRQNNNDKVEIL